MKRIGVALAALLAGSSALVLAQDAPESLLPPGFDDPAPAPAPAPTPAPGPATSSASTPAPSRAPRSVSGNASSATGGASSSNLPLAEGAVAAAPPLPSVEGLPPVSSLPSIAELEEMSTDELDALLGLKPKVDIPPAARRALSKVGILSSQEGGLPSRSLSRQPGSIVKAALAGMKGPLVSRWGHILVRRALVSRLDSPEGMDPVEFAAMRTAALNAMGEHRAARRLAQDVDTGNWKPALIDAAIEAYIGTSDILGTCPVVRTQSDARDTARWQLLQSICAAYAGEGNRARNELRRALKDDLASRLDILLAQRYAGAAGRGRQAVNLEWQDNEGLTPWRFALATALGAEIPAAVSADMGPYYRRVAAMSSALPIEDRAASAAIAAREGLLSSSAMVDLYSQVYAAGVSDADLSAKAALLRDAYVVDDPAARLEAMLKIWGMEERADYADLVLTAYAAARMLPSDSYAEAAAPLIASMLAAGLDSDALQWASVVSQGSYAWGLLALAQPVRRNPVSAAQIDAFIGNDDSNDQRRSAFFVAGLAGLERIDRDTLDEYRENLGDGFGRQSQWSRLIEQAGDARNPALVALLAGVGMQGDSWDRMTPRHLFHIVSALNRAGLDAEARMIAAEAVARS